MVTLPISTVRSVHPRRCGEHRLYPDQLCQHAGSSPQVRGTPPAWRFPLCLPRFIPAGAGNTYSLFATSSALPVHPRRCGEHFANSSVMTDSSGSSPQVRGTPLQNARAYWRYRFIPAGAGNTTYQVSEWQRRKVHPRRCGEHFKNPPRRSSRTGSSPQVRGTQFPSRQQRKTRRFIPAGAGNTPLPCPLPVHPRRCGEHLSAPR